MKLPKAIQGFTLIEVLIAMTLLSIMVVLLFATLKISADSWEKGETKISDVNAMVVVYNFFQRHLSTTKPIWDDFTVPDDHRFSFQGNVQSLTFVSTFPASVDRPGLQHFTVSLRQEDPQNSIEVSIVPFFPAVEGEQFPEEKVTLIKNVKDFTIAYLGQNLTTGESGWQPQWLGRENTPQLIKISIALDNGYYWPDMIIPLKIVGETSGQNESAGAANAFGNSENTNQTE